MATLALGQDNAFGQPLESQLRSCLLAMWLCDAAGAGRTLRDATYWVALLRYIGCTGHAHEVATIFGDEIAIRARTLVHDAADPEEVMRDVLEFATAGRAPEEREQIVLMIEQGAREWAVHNFASGCEVGDMLVERLDFSDDVREALRFTFERWNGNGYPAGVSGTKIPQAMRIVHLTHDMEAIARLFSPARALEAARSRSGRTYDPDVADLFVERGAEWLERLDRLEPWDGVLALEPEPRRVLAGDALDDALLVAADFIDLKSPFMAGHSRRCAELATEAARRLDVPDDEVKRLWRAALVHEFGTTAIPNSIWDKPAALTRAEFDRVELHPMITEQMLRRSPALAPLNGIACTHHEKMDGSGYHRRLRGAAVDRGAAVLAVVDIYVGMTTERADREAFTEAAAATALRSLVAEGVLDSAAVQAVLAAAGHDVPARPSSRADGPGGLTRREEQVLALAARGLTTQQIADRLYISPKTVDHHIQHVYGKIGVSTRAAAALWAMQNGVVN